MTDNDILTIARASLTRSREFSGTIKLEGTEAQVLAFGRKLLAPGAPTSERKCTEGDCHYQGQARPSTCACSKAGA